MSFGKKVRFITKRMYPEVRKVQHFTTGKLCNDPHTFLQIANDYESPVIQKKLKTVLLSSINELLKDDQSESEQLLKFFSQLSN